MTANQVALIDWDESHVDVPDLDLVLPDNAAGLNDGAYDMAAQASAAWEFEPGARPQRWGLLERLSARSTRTCWIPLCVPICAPSRCRPENVKYAMPSSSQARSRSRPIPSIVTPPLHGQAGSVAVKTTHPRGLTATWTMTWKIPSWCRIVGARTPPPVRTWVDAHLLGRVPHADADGRRGPPELRLGLGRRRPRRCGMVRIRTWVLGTYSELGGFALRSKTS
jgi:hypothetical protein